MPNKNRTLVKLDDQYIEIKEGKKGLVAKRLSPEDAFEVSILDEGFDKMLENDINKLANESYNELQAEFKNNLKTNVLKVVGFNRDRWHDAKWEIDHCNGRQSAITELISEKVQQMFRTSFDTMIQPEVDAMMAPLKKSILKEYREIFSREVRRSMQTQAEAAARNFISTVMTKEVTKFQRKALEKAEIAFLGRKATPTDDSEE